MNKIENIWHLAPVAAAQNELAEVRAALGFLPRHYVAIAGLDRLADLLAASEPSTLPHASATDRDEPIAVTVDHDPRGVSIGVWQGSHCIYSGAHPLPAAVGVSTMEKGGATPGATWREKGEADPHGARYNCERAALTLGTLTDDELANGAFLAYDRQPSVDELLSGKGFTPIVWMTAVKDRIRWLSRKLAEAEGRPAPAAGDAQISAYALPDGTRVERAAQSDSAHLWAVRRNGDCLGRDRHWSYEPLPSSRSQEWLALHRFPTAQAAIDAAIAAQQGRGGA